MAVISRLLYLAAPAIIVRRLVLRRMVDTQTVLGAIAAYLMVEMSFAFVTRRWARCRPARSSGRKGRPSPRTCSSGSPPDHDRYADLIPEANPGQTLAVLEMLIGQLFLVTAAAKVVSTCQPGPASSMLDR